MDWPAYSPDLNPIEHVWDMLSRRISARQPLTTCLPELRRALLDEWCNIPQDQIDNLILSMPRRFFNPELCEVITPSKFDDHLRRCHPDKRSKDLKYFQILKEKLQKRLTMDRMFASTLQRDDNDLHASYNISLLIAKSGKSHTIGEELILPAVEELNKSTLPGNESLLLAYVRFIMDEKHHEEMLFARTLTTDTKDKSILNVLKEYFIENSIPLSNIISVATDGAPTMAGRYRGFIGHLKQNVPGVLAKHCFIRRLHLVAKNLNGRLHESLQFVNNTINRIRSNALKTRLFAQLCEENDEPFHQLLLHTEVRWLSKGLCFTRFFALFETVLEFLDSKGTILRRNLIRGKQTLPT
ncbi:protein ZBED8 [Trichonephila clavipes]|nr:protein ZBED8 [Trichonephila clavipes]